MLETVKNALVAVTAKTYHYTAPDNEAAPYIVWAEDAGIQLASNNAHGESGYQGTIDFYTKTENDPLMPAIVVSIENAGIAYYLNSVQYEEETRLIHYEWVFEVS